MSSEKEKEEEEESLGKLSSHLRSSLIFHQV